LEDPHFVALQTALAGRYSLERVLGHGGMGVARWSVCSLSGEPPARSRSSTG